MRLFRSADGECSVTTMLRHMQEGRFLDAFQAFRRTLKRPDEPQPPPHALWRLGRWLAERERPKHARVPLQRFLELYPNHQDRPNVMRDLAIVLAAAGRHEQAQAVLDEADALGRARDVRRSEEKHRQHVLSGRAKEHSDVG